METNKKRFKINVLGKDYLIIGNSTQEHMDAVVEVLAGQLKQINELMPNITQEKAAILVAINAISDQLKKQEKLEKIEKDNS